MMTALAILEVNLPLLTSHPVNVVSRTTMAVGGDNITVHRVHLFPKRQLRRTIRAYLTMLQIKMADVYDLSDDDEHTPEGLPTLPLQTLKQIRAREFINFNSLLSSTLFSPDSDNTDDLRYKIDFSRKKGFSLKASNPARRSVCDLSSFMEAWNSFLKATLYFYPEMLDEMLGYQKLICELAARYKPVAWLAYDKEHRQACAINYKGY